MKAQAKVRFADGSVRKLVIRRQIDGTPFVVWDGNKRAAIVKLVDGVWEVAL